MDYPGKVITKTQVTPTQTSASGNWTLDDQAAAIKNNNWPVALVPNPISKSLRFNSADTAYLNRTPASAGNRRTFTWSGWAKKAKVSTAMGFLSAGTNGNQIFIAGFGSTDDKIYIHNGIQGVSTASWAVTSAVYRDPSAWYHIVLAVDTTQATDTNRIKLYVNNQLQTLSSFSGNPTYPTQNYDTAFNNNVIQELCYGFDNGSKSYFDGYMTEINFIDGQQLTPSSFGMTNPQTGQWIPLKYSGTYGTNGFYLNFKDATSTTTLGYDYSGNANNWTTNNFSVTAGSGNDSLTDVPTPWFAYNTTGDVGGVFRGNYCTFNAVNKSASALATLANGNLDFSGGGAGFFAMVYATIAPTSGKWYWEVTMNASGETYIGISDPKIYPDDNFPGAGRNVGFGAENGYSYGSNGNKYRNGTGTAYGATYASGNIIGVAYDVDAGTLVFYKNNTSQGTAFTGISGGIYAPAVGGYTSNNVTINFGQRPFAYTPPTGFRSLCTTNLPATTIGFGLTNQGDDYFNTVIYTGTGSTRTVTGVGFQPDFLWIKERSEARDHALFDAVRGAGKYLFSNTTDAEDTATSMMSAFTSDGFTVGASSYTNANTQTYVSWNWKAGGTGVSNTAGSITSTVSANTTAGFAIATTTGAGGTGTIGHGLGAVPQFIMCFRRNTAADHYCYHQAIGNTNYLVLNTTAASAASANMWNNTTPTSTVFSVGNTNNNSGDTYVHYIFAPVPGYSAFGSYTGNGSTDGPFAYLGFRPRYLMVKEASGTSAASGNWVIYDAVRDTYNVCGLRLVADNSYAEGTVNAFDFLSNGFKLRTTDAGRNESGGTYIYMAFAESPFQFSNAR